MSPAFILARLLVAVLRNRRGATAIEYGLIIALVVIAMFAGLRNLANATTGIWNYVAREFIAKG